MLNRIREGRQTPDDIEKLKTRIPPRGHSDLSALKESLQESIHHIS